MGSFLKNDMITKILAFSSSIFLIVYLFLFGFYKTKNSVGSLSADIIIYIFSVSLIITSIFSLSKNLLVILLLLFIFCISLCLNSAENKELIEKWKWTSGDKTTFWFFIISHIMYFCLISILIYQHAKSKN